MQTTRWRPVIALVAAALATTLTGCGAGPTAARKAEPLTLQEGVDSDTAGPCKPKTVGRLAQQDLAFAGTVTASDGETSWTFHVDRWYRGRPAHASQDTVELRGGDASLSYVWLTMKAAHGQGDRLLLAAKRFEPSVGTGEGWAVDACLSGARTKGLEALYAKAF